jgi:hypothetical protein
MLESAYDTAYRQSERSEESVFPAVARQEGADSSASSLGMTVLAVPLARAGVVG